MRMCRYLLILLMISAGGTAFGKTKSSGTLWSQIHRDLDAGQNKRALQNISTLEKLAVESVSKAEIAILRGRALYQLGDFSKSLESYEKVPKASDLWLDSVVERAWAKARLGKYNEAVADSKTLMSPLFMDVVGPESYFLSSYVAHRICDFKNVFEITESFKKRNRLRILHLEKMARMEKTRGVADFLKALQKKGVKGSLSTQVASFFPSHFFRSQKFQSAAKKASSRTSNGLALRKVLAGLAESQLAHYKDVIAKLHLIEGDAIQRLHLDRSLGGERSMVGAPIVAGSNDLEFPFDEKDVWVDEIDSLKVNAKNCPTLVKKGASYASKN